MFFKKNKEEKAEERMPRYIIKPNADGSWRISQYGFCSKFFCFRYREMDENYSTVDDAKKAIENLEREWVVVK